MDKQEKLDRLKGCLVGLAIGDAIGVHLEFKPKGSHEKILGFTEGNPYNIPLGCWTDDTSMALCMAQSLIEKKQFDATDIMEKFCQWMKKGYMSSTGTCFDIGNTTRHALMNYWRNPSNGPYCGLTDFDAAGNGSIMRLAPIAMYFHSNLVNAIFYAGESSRITHANKLCVDACRILSQILWQIFNWNTRFPNLKLPIMDVLLKPHVCLEELNNKISEIVIDCSYKDKNEKQIRGTGFVVESLEAAIWACYNSYSFEEAILYAVNLGEDADTTGAIAGQIAGAFYGYDAIPLEWKNQLYDHDMITQLAEQIYNISEK